MKLWRDTIRQVFCGINGVYPTSLGSIISTEPMKELLCNAISFAAALEQYDTRYKAILDNKTVGDDQVW